jgi:hypothetical protein
MKYGRLGTQALPSVRSFWARFAKKLTSKELFMKMRWKLLTSHEQPQTVS